MVKLAKYRLAPHNKIELLYLLGVGWLHRALSGLKNEETPLSWWGRPDWRDPLSMDCWSIADVVRKRFNDELGYKFAAAYPIFDREEGNKIMYYMIHASDHEDAPALMVRAHANAVRPLPKETQLQLIDIAQADFGPNNE